MDEVHVVTEVETVPAQVRSEFEITEVVRQLSHELRQPLSTMESIAYYLSMVVPGHDLRVRQQVEKLQSLVEQMNWVLADAVHFFQATPPNPQMVDLNELITEAVSGEQAQKQPLHVELSARAWS
jgi:signal transduction histidine kinase